ncbi:hypothetical protein BGZ95_008752 [Linnemannia exigua]|uniref:F-box domain-containing protein n=1 Tax=Linnemannia exigua TaxID=604196 RepID=A0AAD4H766_9FUNG|nr:hypothetical protein BGZ95_008752 [Linnemannia exigua]
MATTASSRRVLSLPELTSLIASHLRPPDLATCSRVSRLWNDAFTPSLWHTIDDRLYNWPRIMKDLDGGDPDRPYEEALVWAQQVLQKYGHHIRHLSVESGVMARTVAEIGRTCGGGGAGLHLNSIWFDMPWNRYGGGGAIKQGLVKVPEAIWTPEEKVVLHGILQPGVEFSTYFNSHDWMMTWQWWLLLLKTPALRSLKLFVFESMNLAQVHSQEFFRKSLAVHHRTLTSLQINHRQLSLVDYLEILPNLQHLYCGGDLVGNWYPNETYPRFRTLVTNKPLTGEIFYNLLKHLPGLEDIGVSHLRTLPDHVNFDGNDWTEGDNNWCYRTDFKVSPLLDGVPSRLRGIHFFDECQMPYRTFMSEIAFDVLPSLPFLTEITVDGAYPDLGFALAKYCKLLEVFRNSESCKSILPARRGDRADVNEIGVLLESCPRLRVFDAMEHRLEADHIKSQQPWVCKDLELFRCQLVEFERQNDHESSSYAKAVRTLATTGFDSLTPQQRWKLEKHERCRTQQRPVYDRLAALTQLTTLDLGHEFVQANINVGPVDAPIQYSTHGGRKYITSNRPIPNTMELSLASGLDCLGRLVKLEVFGFSGVDHRIQEAELEWMAKAWPRLRIMRGLHHTPVLGVTEDEVTAGLRKTMQTLRPDVRHEKVELKNALDDSLCRLFQLGVA